MSRSIVLQVSYLDFDDTVQTHDMVFVSGGKWGDAHDLAYKCSFAIVERGLTILHGKSLADGFTHISPNRVRSVYYEGNGTGNANADLDPAFKRAFFNEK